MAIFGLVLVAFGLWVPERFVETENAAREAHKNSQLASIRVDRKKVQVDRMTEEFSKKSEELNKKREKISEVEAELNKKRAEAGAALENAKTAVNLAQAKAARARADELTREVRPLADQVREYTADVDRYVNEYKPIQAQQEEVLDALKSENVELKALHEAGQELQARVNWWLEIMAGSLLAGVILIVTGFVLWYRRVQKFQDSILRKEAT